MLAVIFCFGLIPTVPAQTSDQPQLTELKLPPVRCKIAPSKDVVRWRGTPVAPITPVSEKDVSTQRVESQTPDSRSQLAILNANSLNGGHDCGMPNANSGADNPQSGIRDSKLSSQASIDPVALAQTANQQRSVEPKLPSVRCTIVPTKDAVRWHSTPGTPVAEKDKSTQWVESQTPDSRSPLPTTESTPEAPVADKSTQGVESQTPDISSQLTILSADPPNDHRNPNVNCGISNPQSAIRDPQFNTDAWFQIPTENLDSTDIQEAVLTTSANDNTKVEPQSLIQVLANLARQAQRNFVDPGIPSTETITYNFADSDLDPWEAFTRIAEARGYRIVYRGDIVSLARNEQDSVNPGNAYTVKAEIWLDQSAKPRAHQSDLAIQLADTNVAPKSTPRTVQSLQPGSNAKISLTDVQSERGDSTIRLTVNPVLLPNGNVQADLGIDNAVPSADGHKTGAIRRTTKFTVELTPTKQVIAIDGLLMPNNEGKRAWFQLLFRKRAPANGTARMVMRLTVEPVGGSETPPSTPKSVSPKSTPGSSSSKTGIVLATTVESPKR